MSVPAGRDRIHTRRSLFERSDRGLDEEVIKINGVADFFKRHLDVFYVIYADFACPPGSFDRRA